MTELELLALPSIEHLKERLKTAGIGSGVINPEFKAIGFEVDDHEAQHALVNQHNEVQFNTGVELPLVVYRGQTQEYNNCVPGLGRPHQNLKKKINKAVSEYCLRGCHRGPSLRSFLCRTEF